MALAELNRRLGAFLARITPGGAVFDLQTKRSHLEHLQKFYACEMREDDDKYVLSRTDIASSRSFRVSVQFSDITNGEYTDKYAIVKNILETSPTPKTITLGRTSQLQMEEWFESIFASLPAKEKAKRAAGYRAVDDYVANGMVVGLGTGSTAKYAVDRVGQKVRLGILTDITCIPTSERTREQAVNLNLTVKTLDELGDRSVNVAIDGADAVDLQLNLIKGGGGALLREKMVESMTPNFICIVDSSKLCAKLGPSFDLPVEITPYCAEHTMRQIEHLPILGGGAPHLRRGNVENNKDDGYNTAVTENGNFIVDIHYEDNQFITRPKAAANALKGTVGVVEHGLFCGMAKAVIVAYPDGSCIKYGEGGIQPNW